MLELISFTTPSPDTLIIILSFVVLYLTQLLYIIKIKQDDKTKQKKTSEILIFSLKCGIIL